MTAPIILGSDATFQQLREIRVRSEKWASQTRFGGTPVRDLAPSNAAQGAWDRAWLIDYIDALARDWRSS